MTIGASADYVFAPVERPSFPGSPYSPRHTACNRLGYLAIALVAGITSNLVNSMVTVNLPSLAGSMGIYVAQAAWLPAIYVAFNATANLTLVKARIHFGIPGVTLGLLACYAATVVYQMIWPSYEATLVIRAVCGMAMAPLSTLSIYNLLQVFTGPTRPLALLIGISIPQLGLPLARLVPVELLAFDNWSGLHLVELGLIGVVAAAAIALPLPPSDRGKAFQGLDLLTVGLLVPAFVLICGALGIGRYVWWTDTPYLGLMLAAAIPLVAAAIIIEHHRSQPLIQTRWIGTVEILRFAAVAFVARIALAEQSYGSVGLLTLGGLTNDQLHLLFALVAVAIIAGVATAVVTLKPDRIPIQVLVGSLVVAFGAWLDTDISNLTRPHQLIGSQMLIGFGTALFIGPALLYGFIRVLQRGPDYLLTMIVLFSATQNLGGLAGSALLGTWQTIHVRAHQTALSQRLNASDPFVTDRIAQGATILGGVVTEPYARQAQGAALLARSMSFEANVLAFTDVFHLVMLIALGNATFLAATLARRRILDSHSGLKT